MANWYGSMLVSLWNTIVHFEFWTMPPITPRWNNQDLILLYICYFNCDFTISRNNLWSYLSYTFLTIEVRKLYKINWVILSKIKGVVVILVIYIITLQLRVKRWPVGAKGPPKGCKNCLYWPQASIWAWKTLFGS